MSVYNLFGNEVTIPNGVREYLTARNAVDDIISHALESVDKLFGGILSSRYDYVWGCHDTPDSDEDNANGYFCLKGLLNCASGDCMSGDVISEVNRCLQSQGYSQISMARDYGEFRQLQEKHVAKYNELYEACVNVKDMRESEAERASGKTSDSVLGSVFNTVQSVRKSVRAKAFVTSDNIALGERFAFAGIEYDDYAKEMRESLVRIYRKMRDDLHAYMDGVEVPGWGVPSEMAARAARIDARRDKLTKEDIIERILSLPFDVGYAVQCVGLFGHEVRDLSRMIVNLGLDWNAACAEYFSKVKSHADFNDEDHLLQQREEIKTLVERFDGVSCAREVLQAVEQRLKEIDLECRTVGEIVCSTREEAACSRNEKPAVDAVVEGVKLFPLSAVDALIATVVEKNFKTEYGKAVLGKLRKHRKYMLTVDGVAYETWEEAEKAFAQGQNKMLSIVARGIAFGSESGERLLTAAKRWPGSLDPDSITGEIRSGNLVGAVGTAGRRIVDFVKHADGKSLSALGKEGIKGCGNIMKRNVTAIPGASKLFNAFSKKEK